MKILIIGGTGFLGRHLVAAAQAQQQVTLFRRGSRPAADLLAVEEIYGDRSDQVEALRNRRWDAVIDTCGYLPQTVATVAEALRDSMILFSE